MPSPRQRPIPVTARERQLLEQQRKVYESKVGETSDWGEFLEMAVVLGLVALGVYALTRPSQRADQSVSLNCSACGRSFLMALPPSTVPMYLPVQCPHCGAGLVVDFREQPA